MVFFDNFYTWICTYDICVYIYIYIYIYIENKVKKLQI